MGNRDRFTIAHGAFSVRRAEEVPARHIEHDAGCGKAVMNDANRHGVVRKPVQEVRGSIERIDNERKRAVVGLSIRAQLFADYYGTRELRMNRRDDGGFCATVDLGDEVGGCFLLPDNVPDCICRLSDHLGRFARGGDGNLQRVFDQRAVLRGSGVLCLQRVPHTC